MKDRGKSMKGESWKDNEILKGNGRLEEKERLNGKKSIGERKSNSKESMKNTEKTGKGCLNDDGKTERRSS